MSTTINQETSKMLKQTSEIIARHEKELKVAEVRQEKHLNRLQRHEKDVLLPSDKPIAKAGVATKPQLSTPTTSFSGFANSREPSLIGLMGEVLALQAKTNSNFWSTLWKQASQSMLLQVKFAPVIANAIKSSYNAAASQTKLEAQKSFNAGIASTIGFGLTLGLGVLGEVKDPTPGGLKGDDDTAFKNEDVGLPKEETPEGEVSEVDNTTNKTLNNQSKAVRAESKGEQLTRNMKSKQSLLGRGGTTMNAVVGKAVNSATMVNMGVTAYTSFNSANYDNQKATQQQLEGQEQAVSKEAEQYAQYYGQSFSRQENLREGSSQNIDYAMNILKSAVDSITQTVTGMFRG